MEFSASIELRMEKMGNLILTLAASILFIISIYAIYQLGIEACTTLQVEMNKIFNIRWM